MTVEIRVTTPMSAPTRRMPQPPIPMPQLSSSVVFSKEGGLPQEIHSTGRLFLMHAEEAQEAPDVVLGMFSVNSVLARVLFDFGASHSFVTEEFACTSKIQPTKLKHVMIVQIPGSTTKAMQICKAV